MVTQPVSGCSPSSPWLTRKPVLAGRGGLKMCTSLPPRAKGKRCLHLHLVSPRSPFPWASQEPQPGSLHIITTSLPALDFHQERPLRAGGRGLPVLWVSMDRSPLWASISLFVKKKKEGGVEPKQQFPGSESPWGAG